jgi:hypothetical protein
MTKLSIMTHAIAPGPGTLHLHMYDPAINQNISPQLETSSPPSAVFLMLFKFLELERHAGFEECIMHQQNCMSYVPVVAHTWQQCP